MKIKDAVGHDSWQCPLCAYPPFAALFALNEHVRKAHPESKGELA